MSGDGYGWMTGAAMRPISMRINSEIARNTPELRNLYASGGVMSADNAIEYMMQRYGSRSLYSRHLKRRELY